MALDFGKNDRAVLCAHQCALVHRYGVGNTRKSMQVLAAMDMPARAIVDLDYAFNGVVTDGLSTPEDPDILFCKRIFREMAFPGKDTPRKTMCP